MSVLVLLWVGMLGVIYISSYIDVLKNNERMLRVHADMYMPPTEFGMPENKPAPPEDKHGFSDSPQFRLSTFYTVALTYGGDVIEIKNEQPTVHSDSELRALAEKIIAEGKANGKKNDLVYYASDKGGYMLVTFMDNTIINESATTLFSIHPDFRRCGDGFVLFSFNYSCQKDCTALGGELSKAKAVYFRCGARAENACFRCWGKCGAFVKGAR